MPRKPRLLSSSGIYHTILRSVNQHLIFEEESDYRKFLSLLSDCKKKYSIDIYAYCLMDNHVHLLLYSPPESLSLFFLSLGTRFAVWYNKKYARSGHLFQDRYFSKPVENEKALFSTLIYIHNNPVKANMCRYPSEYRWSSYNAYYGAKNSLINTTFAYKTAGSQGALHKFFAENSGKDEIGLFDYEIPEKKTSFTDEQALRIFKKTANVNTTYDAAGFEKVKRNELIRSLKVKGLTAKQIARFMGVSTRTIERVWKNVGQTPSLKPTKMSDKPRPQTTK